MIDALVHGSVGGESDDDPLASMMRDPFANYVVQRLVEVCLRMSGGGGGAVAAEGAAAPASTTTSPQHRQASEVLDRVRAQMAELRRTAQGKHIVSRIERLMEGGSVSSAASAAVRSSGSGSGSSSGGGGNGPARGGGGRRGESRGPVTARRYYPGLVGGHQF